jgi:hypothetical protein
VFNAVSDKTTYITVCGECNLLLAVFGRHFQIYYLLRYCS